MTIHGYRHVRKVNDGRPKPYFGRITFEGEPIQIGGFATAREAHEAAIQKLNALKQPLPPHDRKAEQ